MRFRFRRSIRIAPELRINLGKRGISLSTGVRGASVTVGYGVWMNGGFSAVIELLSPFNIVNWLVTVITLAPGIAALMWAEKLRTKTSYSGT